MLMRQLVKARAAQESADLRYARVVLHLERLAASLVLGHQFLFALFGIYVHASELVHGKQFAVTPHAGLLENDRPLVVANLDCCGTEQENGGKDYQG